MISCPDQRRCDIRDCVLGILASNPNLRGSKWLVVARTRIHFTRKLYHLSVNGLHILAHYKFPKTCRHEFQHRAKVISATMYIVDIRETAESFSKKYLQWEEAATAIRKLLLNQKEGVQVLITRVCLEQVLLSPCHSERIYWVAYRPQN